MKFDKQLTELISILPQLKHFITPEGTLYTKLLKALYRCIQSSRLWYNKLVPVLQCLHYETCLVDQCIMCCIINNKVHLIIIYVDDLLLLANKVEADQGPFIRIQLDYDDKRCNTVLFRNQITLQEQSIMIDMPFFTKPKRNFD
jgi:hypothetical protein